MRKKQGNNFVEFHSNTTSRLALEINFSSQKTGNARNLLALVHVRILRRIGFEAVETIRDTVVIKESKRE
jgi:hypothetical protein